MTAKRKQFNQIVRAFRLLAEEPRLVVELRKLPPDERERVFRAVEILYDLPQ